MNYLMSAARQNAVAGVWWSVAPGQLLRPDHTGHFAVLRRSWSIDDRAGIKGARAVVRPALDEVKSKWSEWQLFGKCKHRYRLAGHGRLLALV
jgi:hypothetical protein